MLGSRAALSLAMALLAATARPGDRDNLVRNGDFEDGLPGQPAPGWKGMTIADEAPQEGRGCGHRKEGYGRQDIDVLPNTAYVFEVDVKSAGREWTTLEVISGATGKRVINVSKSGRFDWQHWKQTVRTLPNETSLHLYLGYTAANWWDGISVCALKPAAIAGESPQNNSLFVSPHGDDASSGTREKPWRTVRSAAARLQAGDTLHILPGIYREAVNALPSGTEGAPITFLAEGTRVVFDGGNKLLQAFEARGIQFVRFVGLEIRNYARAATWINDSNYMTFRNDYIHHNGNHSETEGNGIYGWGHGWVIENCRITGNCPRNHYLGSGICVSGRSFTIRNNTVEYNNGNGILLEDQFDTVVENNIVRFNHGDGATYGCGGIWVDGGYGITVRNNWFEGNEWSGILLSDEDSGDPYGYTVYNNICTRNWYGIWIGGIGREDNPCRIHNNTLVDNLCAGLWFSNVPYLQNVNVKVVNNIVAQMTVNAPALMTDGVTGAGCVMDKNLYYRAPALDEAAPPTRRPWGLVAPDGPGEFQAALIWRGRADVSRKLDIAGGRAANAAGTGLTMAEYQRLTGFDKNSLNTDPLFLMPQLGDYRLRRVSPCIGAGASEYMPDHDYSGKPRPVGSRATMGAFSEQALPDLTPGGFAAKAD